MAELTLLTIHERDITSEVCRRCARCCEVDLQLTNTNPRYRRFLRGVGFRLTPPPKEGSDDCCDAVHDVTLHLGPCRHLRKDAVNGETLFSCGLYGDARRPELCEHFNCVSWAKASNSYNLGNAMLRAAQEAWLKATALEPGETKENAHAA